jgi:hypothetical protein
VAAAAGLVIGLVPWAVLSAHTETSFVAVPASEEAAVAFRPTHGCGGSPTISVSVRAPVPEARAGEVDGWTGTATADGEGNTVVEWTGGLLPADEAGAFPVELVVPDAVGTLLAFPAIQRCENGEELAWIGTAPGDPQPAPQVLVLAAGSEPAATLDDVPLDAPGRDLLVALTEGVVDDDNPTAAPATTEPAAPTTATPTTTTTTAAPTTTAVPSTGPPTSSPATTSDTAAPTASSAPATTDAEDDDGGGTSAGVIAAIVAGIVIVLGGVAVALARRHSSTPA